MIVWSICHMKFKMITSHLLLLFLFFHNFDFLGCLREKGDERAKNGPKWQNNIVSISQELCLIWLWFFVHMCKMMVSPAVFFIFSIFKIDFSGFSKFINKCQKEILRCVPPSSHVCHFISFQPPSSPLSLCTSYWWYVLILFSPYLISF